jgi:hypothetical protein
VPKVARGIARLLGTPQDIERAVAGDGIYTLQARQITTRAVRNS